MAKAPVWVNGLPTSKVEVADRGFQYGDGLFETLLLQRGVPHLWSAHLRRLRRGCARLRLAFPDPDLLRREAEGACLAEQGVLKLILTRGVGGRGYAPSKASEPTRVFSFHPMPADLKALKEGVEARWCRTRLSINPALAGIKHLNRLEQILARSEWDDPAVYEGLMCDVQGFVVEGTKTNVFWRRAQTLYTPKLDRCGVAGIARAWVVAKALAWGMAVEEVRARPSALLEGEEVFLTNSVIGPVPVVALADRRWPVGLVTARLQASWQRSLAEAAW
ncbi:aminodeoxychorismate lyase [Methylothermus subterraneus]